MEHTITLPSDGYELLDSGNGQKLERYGALRVARPDPQALWSPMLPKEEWTAADATYERHGARGAWTVKNKPPEPWQASIAGSTFNLKLMPSKHVGLFPEQAGNWEVLRSLVSGAVTQGKKVSVLNLFGYSGGASLAAAAAGADVTHIDASEAAVDMATANRDASQMSAAPIRFIVDDARKFIEREIKRGHRYDVIVLDPPVYGTSGKGDTWNIETDLKPLLLRLTAVLSAEPLAVFLSGYAAGYSATTYAQLLSEMATTIGGRVESGELFIKESGHAARLLPAGISARWFAK